MLTNSSGNTVWRAELEAFQRSVLSTSIGDFNIGFPWQYWDAEKQSWYNYFRDYDARTGRYLQSDPIGLQGGLNTYAYVGSNPIMSVDPLGLTVKLCSAELGSGIPLPVNSKSPFRHDYLVVNGRSFGFYPEESTSSNLTYGSGDVVHTDDPNNAQCKVLVADESKDRAVLEATKAVGKPDYSVLAGPYPLKISLGLNMLGAMNCQSWVDAVLHEAEIQK